jgi:hypothetical protein
MAWDDGLPDSAAYWWPRYARTEEPSPEECERRRKANKERKYREYLAREAKRRAKKQIENEPPKEAE